MMYEHAFVDERDVREKLNDGWEPTPHTQPVYSTQRSLNRQYDEKTVYVFLRRAVV